VREHRNGRRSGGACFSRGQLYGLIANPLFIGRVRHKEAVHPGQHEAIVEEPLWQAVQDRIAANRRTRSAQSTARAPSPLAGKLFDPEGAKMRPGHASTKGRCYRYYVSADLIQRGIAAGAKGWRIPAAELEAAVARAIALRLRGPDSRVKSSLVRMPEPGTPLNSSNASARLPISLMPPGRCRATTCCAGC
jgi:hypothetical protein